MKKLLLGCCCAGWLVGNAQSSAIFKGGSGDGHYRASYIQQSVSFWQGSSGDGYAKNNYAQNSANFWLGGSGDGHSATGYSQNTVSFWKGGTGDGYAAGNYQQNSVSFWKGGTGDGWSRNAYTQNSASFWKGGVGDGWAAVYKPQGPLPLTWLSFEAEKWQDKYSHLTWKTASERNVSHFEIERGQNAVDFVKVATLRAAGNTSATTTYTLNDSLPLKGFNYYRIKQVDLDGRSSYSPARLVRFDMIVDNVIRIYPNPAKDFVNIEIPEAMRSENVIINLVSLTGAVVDHVKVPAGSNSFVRLNTSRFARAAYTVHLISAMQNHTTRIVLQ